MRSLLCFALPFLLLILSVAAMADGVDDAVNQEMQTHPIPGPSRAIIQAGKIVEAKGYAYADIETKSPVTPSTLFRAGSIGKPVAAIGALSLVEDGRLSLDADVNAKLILLRAPKYSNTATQKLTLRRKMHPCSNTPI